MKTRIYFVRHAHPDFSIRDDMIRPKPEVDFNKYDEEDRGEGYYEFKTK